jgi:hypothetical protein
MIALQSTVYLIVKKTDPYEYLLTKFAIFKLTAVMVETERIVVRIGVTFQRVLAVIKSNNQKVRYLNGIQSKPIMAIFMQNKIHSSIKNQSQNWLRLLLILPLLRADYPFSITSVTIFEKKFLVDIITKNLNYFKGGNKSSDHLAVFVRISNQEEVQLWDSKALVIKSVKWYFSIVKAVIGRISSPFKIVFRAYSTGNKDDYVAIKNVQFL